MKTGLKQKIDWDICTSPLIINDSIDSKKQAILRNDNNQLLGIVGKDYCPLSNTQLMEFTDALTKTGEFELQGFDELNDGKVILAFLKNTNPNLKINGCLNDEYMFIGNSFDGTKRFHIGTTSSLARCSNQFASTLKVFSKKHTSFFDTNETMIKNIIKNYKTKKAILYESFDGMETVRVDESIILKLIKEIYAMLNNDSKSIKQKDWTKSPSMLNLRKCIDLEMKDLGNNAFGLFNGVTWFTSHEMRSKEGNYSQINGHANLINQKAFRFCNNLKRSTYN